MKEFFKRLFGKNKCNHKWETIREFNVKTYDEFGDQRHPIHNAITFVQRCTECGELKHYTVDLGV